MNPKATLKVEEYEDIIRELKSRIEIRDGFDELIQILNNLIQKNSGTDESDCLSELKKNACNTYNELKAIWRETDINWMDYGILETK